MNVLCIDVGNSRTHFGVVRKGEVLWQGAVPTRTAADPAGGLPAKLRELAKEPFRPEGIAYCSVVPAATKLLEPILTETRLPVFHLTWDQCAPLGLPLEYPQPEQLGQDRLALAFGTLAYHGAPAVAIDLGTAVTFDVLSRRGTYLGGVIAPGLEMIARALHEQTALLPQLNVCELEVTGGIGTNTVEAMKIGCATGFAGMIRAILERVLGELRARGEENVRVVATGGSAGQLPHLWVGKIEYDADLLLRGLEEAWRRKEAAKPGQR